MLRTKYIATPDLLLRALLKDKQLKEIKRNSRPPTGPPPPPEDPPSFVQERLVQESQ